MLTYKGAGVKKKKRCGPNNQPPRQQIVPTLFTLFSARQVKIVVVRQLTATSNLPEHLTLPGQECCRAGATTQHPLEIHISTITINNQ